MIIWIAVFAIRFRRRAQQLLEAAADRRDRQPRLRAAFAPRRCRGLLRTQAFPHQEAVRQHHQAGVVMEPTPGPALGLIQAQSFLHLLVALLHRPAALPEADRLEPTRPHREIREGDLDLAVGLLLDQQPERLGTGTSSPLPALRRPDPDPTELPPQLPLGPFPPGPFPAGQALGQFPETDRPRALHGQAGVRPRTAPGRAL